MSYNFSHQLIDFSIAKTTTVPKSALDIITLSLLDWVGVAQAADKEDVSRIIKQHISPLSGAGSAAVFGSASPYPMREAALANGTMSHALDYDDTHFAHIGHLSTVVLPTVMALVDPKVHTLKAIKDAAAIGFETACRIGIWLGRDHYQVGFHQTATAGSLGAVLAGARLLNLDAVSALHALGLATSRASGLKSQFGAMGKPMNAGFAAANAVEAVLLAKMGTTSCDEPLEGQNGFGETHHAEQNTKEALSGLGEQFVLEDNQYKFHACCHGLHAALEALNGIVIENPVDEIASVTIKTHPRWMTVCNIETPSTGLETKFSYKMTAALHLSGFNTARLDTYLDQHCSDESLCVLRDKVVVSPDASLTEMEAHVFAKTTDGGTQNASFDLMSPMPLKIKQARLMEKSKGLIGEEKTEQLWALCQSSDLKATAAFLRFMQHA